MGRAGRLPPAAGIGAGRRSWASASEDSRTSVRVRMTFLGILSTCAGQKPGGSLERLTPPLVTQRREHVRLHLYGKGALQQLHADDEPQAGLLPQQPALHATLRPMLQAHPVARFEIRPGAERQARGERPADIV